MSIAITQQLAVNYLGQFLLENLEFRLKYPENTCFLSVQPQNAVFLASSFTFLFHVLPNLEQMQQLTKKNSDINLILTKSLPQWKSIAFWGCA